MVGTWARDSIGSEPTGWVAWGLGSQLRFCLTKPGEG